MMRRGNGGSFEYRIIKGVKMYSFGNCQMAMAFRQYGIPVSERTRIHGV